MTIDEFMQLPHCPTSESIPLQALWYDRQGDWHTAHQLVQDEPDTYSAWVHAYLHREEGDLSNARYWYGRARQPESTSRLEEEWRAIAHALLLNTVG